MIRGLYISAWSMLVDSKRMDVIANNLANASTNAFKKDTVVLESFPEMLTRRLYDTRSRINPTGLVGTMHLGRDVGEVFTYYTQGSLMKTDSTLDMAISGADTAFFTVALYDENGQMREIYTRDGSFVLNGAGMLVTKEGYEVLGENGPIFLESDDFVIENDGTIVQNGQVVDRLLIRQFEDTGTLRKLGSNLVQATEETVLQEFTGTVRQGFIEQSNVNIVKEMVDMINVMRSYEANQKILQIQDSTLDRAVNEVGTVR